MSLVRSVLPPLVFFGQPSIASREASPLMNHTATTSGSTSRTTPIRSRTVFDQILDGQLPAEVVHEDERSLAFYDINPVAPVHILVIPKRRDIPRISEPPWLPGGIRSTTTAYVDDDSEKSATTAYVDDDSEFESTSTPTAPGPDDHELERDLGHTLLIARESKMRNRWFSFSGQ
eukprot:GSA25T00014444001.1